MPLRPLFTLALLAALSGAAQAEAVVTLAVPAAGLNPTITGSTFATHSISLEGPAITGSVSGEVDLAAGTLHAFLAVTPQTTSFASNALSSVRLTEGFTLVGPAAGLIPIVFRMDVDAQFSTGGPIASGSETLGLSALMSVAGAAGSASSAMSITRFLRFANGQVASNTIACSGSDCFFDTPLTTAGTVDGHLLHEALVAVDTPFSFTASLQASASGAPGLFAGVDAGHTARLSVLLPEGYTLHSQSGVFLSAVPEPHPLALACAALAGFALRRRFVR